MGFNLKPQRPANAGESNIDYKAIAEKIEDGANPAVISLVVDLGEQNREDGVDDKEVTEFNSESEALQFIDRVIELFPKTGNTLSPIQKGNKYIVNAKVYPRKPIQEVAIFADLPNTLVDYGDEIGEKPYRVLLNQTYMGQLRGFALAASPPTKGDLWTFAPNSMLTKIARATKTTEIISKGDDNMNIGLVLGKPLLVEIVKSGDFINAKSVMSLMAGMQAPTLPEPAIGISFDSVTVGDLAKAKLRKSVVDKIKGANNYKGSQMQKALEAYESTFSKTEEVVDRNDVPPVINDDDDIPF